MTVESGRRPGVAGVVVALLLALGPLILPAPAAADPYTVAAVAKVSGLNDLPPTCRARQSESQPQLVVDPTDANRLTAVYQQDGSARGVVGAVSDDGGMTWTRHAVAHANRCSGGPPERAYTVNPLLAGGPGGTAYFGNSWINDTDQPLYRHGTVVHRFDGRWSSGRSPGSDDPSQNVAPLADPDRPGELTAIWTHYGAQVPNPFAAVPLLNYVRAARSSDGGATFSPPSIAAIAPIGKTVINVRLARSSDGDLLGVFDAADYRDVPNSVSRTQTRFAAYAIRSSDGGRTWSDPAPAGEPVFLPLADPDRGGTALYSAKFDLATGPDGAAVIVWAEHRDGQGVIRMSRSRDGGRSWSEPFDALRTTSVAFMPAAAIGADGTFGLFWYDWAQDRRGDDQLSTDAWFASSPDGGATWERTHLAGPFDLRASRDPGLAYDGGPLGVYQDLVALPGGFGAIFSTGPPLAVDGRVDVDFVRLAEASSAGAP